MKYCPLCNWEIVNGKCTNTISLCQYRGNGFYREPIASNDRLGDITGEPRNNGDYSSTNYDD